MLIFPIAVFLLTRGNRQTNKVILKKYFGSDDNKCNIYGAILAVCTVYSIIWIYIITYYLEDFKSVFCKKKVGDEKKSVKAD
jgi:hypothetical protein